MWVRIREAAELEKIIPDTMLKRTSRGLESRKENGCRLVRLEDLSPQAQERWRGRQGRTEGSKVQGSRVQGEEWARYPERVRQEAEARLKIILSCPRRGVRRWFISLNGQRPPGMKSYTAFQRWIKKYKDVGIDGLVDMRGRVRRNPISPELQATIAGLYLQPYRPTITQVHGQLRSQQAAISNQQPALPTLSQIRRYINRELLHSAKCLARHGTEAYENEMPYTQRIYDSLPGEVFVADHTQIDVAVISPSNGRPTFPWLTALMDETSRKIVGWWLDERPSARTIAACLRRSLLSFTPPKFLRADNGRDFSSRFIAGGQWRFRSHRVALDSETEGVLTRLGVKLLSTLPYRGRSKVIERWFGREKEELLKTLPGYRGGSVGERPEGLAAELKSRALLSFQDFHKLLEQWVASYNASPHRGLNNKTPNEVFNAEDRQQSLVNQNALTLLMMPSEKRLVYRNGVQFMGSWYYDPILENLRRDHVLLRYDPAEINRIAIFDVRGSFTCWADRRLPLSHMATQAEVAGAMREEKTLRKSTRQYIAWAQDSVNREDLVKKILEERKAKIGQDSVISNQQSARRLHTPWDKEATEMMVAKELGDRPCTTRVQGKGQGEQYSPGAPPPGKKTFLPGEGRYLEED